MKDEYKGYKIVFRDTDEKWIACLMETEEIAKGSYSPHEPDFEDLSRRGLLEKIDAGLKKQFKRIKVLELHNPRGYVSDAEQIREGEITSFNESGSAWVSWADGRREKCGINCIYLDTPENRAILETVIEKKKQMQKLEEEQTEIRKKLTHAHKIDEGD